MLHTSSLLRMSSQHSSWGGVDRSLHLAAHRYSQESANSSHSRGHWESRPRIVYTHWKWTKQGRVGLLNHFRFMPSWESCLRLASSVCLYTFTSLYNVIKECSFSGSVLCCIVRRWGRWKSLGKIEERPGAWTPGQYAPLRFQEAPRGNLSPIKPWFLLSEVPAAQTWGPESNTYIKTIAAHTHTPYTCTCTHMQTHKVQIKSWKLKFRDFCLYKFLFHMFFNYLVDQN